MAVQRLAVVPRARGQEVTLALDGELDAYSVRQLAAELDTLRRDGHRHVRLDMANLTFLDSAGLQTLVEQDAALRSDGGRLVVERAADPVRRVLRVAGVDAGVGGLTVE